MRQPGREGQPSLCKGPGLRGVAVLREGPLDQMVKLEVVAEEAQGKEAGGNTEGLVSQAQVQNGVPSKYVSTVELS